jgi:hypothetical protein
MHRCPYSPSLLALSTSALYRCPLLVTPTGALYECPLLVPPTGALYERPLLVATAALRSTLYWCPLRVPLPLYGLLLSALMDVVVQL